MNYNPVTVSTGLTYTHRGDPASVDFAVGDFTIDGANHEKDISSIIPVGTKLVFMQLKFECQAANANIAFMKKGITNNVVVSGFITGVANIGMKGTVVAPPDADRKIQYMFTNATWTLVEMTVIGWFI